MRTAIAGLTVGLMIASSAYGALPLARDGKALAVIVHNGHTNQAASLHEYLQKITGADFDRVATSAEAGERPAIILETVKKIPGSSNRPEIAMQAYRIASDDKSARLSGGSEIGLTYAVWGFLEDHLGCRFYISKGFEVVPSKPTLAIDKIDDFQQPAFAQRGFVWSTGLYPWVLKNRGAGYPADKTSGDLRATHNLHNLLPPSKLFAEHPEFYPLNNDGKRWQGAMGICGTNPDLPAYLAAALQAETEKLIKAQGDSYDPMMPISAAQGDGFSGCQCDACRKLVLEEESEAAPYILALNRALDILGKTHPKQQVITFAYFGTLATPKTIKPHKNLWINVVSSDYSGQAAGDTVGPIHDNPANRDYAKALLEWPKVAPGRVVVWHWWGLDSYLEATEWPCIFYLADMVKFCHKAGLYGMSPQGCGSNWRGLYNWVFLKLAWNPDADADALIRQFLEDNYGKGAAPYVWEYLKLAQAGYADSIHVPNTCRWTGFTTTMRLMMYRTSLLKQMTEVMDKAEAAAAKEKNPVLLANTIVAKSTSVDPLNIDAAKAAGEWGPVKNKQDGKRWFAPGADPEVPPAVMRVRRSILEGGGGYGHLQTFAAYGDQSGGPLVTLESDKLSADVCPDLKGQVTSAVDKKSGKELLAVAATETGYRDMFNIRWQVWLPDGEWFRKPASAWMDMWNKFANPSKTRLDAELMLSPGLYGFNPNNRLRRSVVVDGDAMRIERTYVQSQGGNMPNPTRFTTRWLLALPDPSKANIAVVGGGIKTMLDLHYAVPGGIQGAKTGERLSVGEKADPFIVDNITYAEAVSDSQVTTLAVDKGAEDTITLRLDRGDGVAAVLTTAAAGWEKIELQPMIEKKQLRVTLIGVPVAMGPDPVTNALPVQTLTAKAVPVSTLEPITAEEKLTKAKIKELGNGRAINELDGAELIWIPAGKFLRGSPDGKGAANERPRKEIDLDGYWIYKHPVTMAQYLKFCEAMDKKFAPHWGQGMHAQPVGNAGAYAALVNWFEAEAYAKWVGAALPTEAQWEKAARGTDGREYPWGDEWDPEKAVGRERTIDRFSAGLMPVGSSPAGASPYGVEDMAGNCWEWVADWYEHEYYSIAPAKNPMGPEKGTHKVLRGGYALFDERLSRSAARMVQPPHVRDWTLTGFRCVVTGTVPERP